jgi:hypothetical protein
MKVVSIKRWDRAFANFGHIEVNEDGRAKLWYRLWIEDGEIELNYYKAPIGIKSILNAKKIDIENAGDKGSNRHS